MKHIWLGQSHLCGLVLSLPHTSDSLYHLLVVSDHVSLLLPVQHTYNSVDIQACVLFPFATFYTRNTGTLNIIPNGSIYDISCNNCYLTNRINSSTKPKACILLCQPLHAMLPVNLSSFCCENPAMFCPTACCHFSPVS